MSSDPDPKHSVTRLLHRWREGDERAAGELLPLIYDELYRIARRKMGEQAREHTLQATALVNEAYLKLFQGDAKEVRDRKHFMALASRAMRSVLVDHARAKNRHKRRPRGECVSLDDLTATYQERALDLVELDEALNLLAERDELMVRIVELHFFGGLTFREIAEDLELSESKVMREWTAARAWLFGILEEGRA